MIGRLGQLEKRELVMLCFGAIFVLIALLYIGVYEPYQNALTNADKAISAKRRQIVEVQKLQAEYFDLQKMTKDIEGQLAKRSGLSALALLENIASTVGSRENLSYIRPQPAQTQGEIYIENLDIKLEKLTLQQVLQLLWNIDTAKTPMQIKNMRLKQRFDNQALTDATLTVSVFRKNR